MKASPDSPDILAKTATNQGETLAELSEQSPVLLVLLRHEGCLFCRNAMSDIARSRSRIESIGTRIVLGHMGTAEDFASFALRYGLSDVAFVTDPKRELYKGLGLKRGRLMQLLGPRVLLTWFKTALSGHLPGRIKGDVSQLPGAFLLHHGQVIKSHAYRDASDRPNYLELATA
jgi:hypothetical protein